MYFNDYGKIIVATSQKPPASVIILEVLLSMSNFIMEPVGVQPVVNMWYKYAVEPSE